MYVKVHFLKIKINNDIWYFISDLGRWNLFIWTCASWPLREGTGACWRCSICSGDVAHNVHTMVFHLNVEINYIIIDIFPLSGTANARWFLKLIVLISIHVIQNSKLQQDGTRESFEYGRYGNPTTKVAEEKIRSIYILCILCVFALVFLTIMTRHCLSNWVLIINLSSALEGAETTLLMASGMYASIITLIALRPEGGNHIVITSDCYRKTRIFIQTILPQMGVSVMT